MSGKFQNFFDARKRQEPEERPAQPEVPPVPTSESARRVGRPPGGKKSNAEYQQVTAYIRKRTYRLVQIELLEQDTKQDFSELVEELLAAWLERNA